MTGRMGAEFLSRHVGISRRVLKIFTIFRSFFPNILIKARAIEIFFSNKDNVHMMYKPEMG